MDPPFFGLKGVGKKPSAASDAYGCGAVLCGNNGEACWAKYGSYPLHRSYCHEMALRILLASIESHANRYKRHIVPVKPVSAFPKFLSF